jgi:hypothetical protein
MARNMRLREVNKGEIDSMKSVCNICQCSKCARRFYMLSECNPCEDCENHLHPEQMNICTAFTTEEEPFINKDKEES